MSLTSGAYQFLPVLNYALKRFGIERDVADAAAHAELLQPEETEDLPLPLCLEGQIDLIIGTPRFDNLADQLALVRKTRIVHAPVVRYTLENCMVQASGVYFRGGSYRKHNLCLRDLLTTPRLETEEALYSMSFVSHAFFGHFIRDACATALLAQPGQALLLDVKPEWPHAAEYVAVFRLEPASPGPRFVRRLTLCDDRSQGTHKRARYKELRRRISRAYGPWGEATDTVYLRRGNGGAARLVADEDRVVESLAARGYRIVALEGATMADLAKELRNARRVVTMEGSHINHVHYLTPPGLDLCVLMANDQTTFVHRAVGHAFGARFGFVVCRRVGDAYRLDLDQLLRTMDLFD